MPQSDDIDIATEPRAYRSDIAASVWRLTGAVYLFFAAIVGFTGIVSPGFSTDRALLAVTWLSAAAAVHLASQPPAITSHANHAALCCAWVTVAGALIVDRPNIGPNIAGAAFVGPLIAVRLTSRRLIAAHALAAAGLYLSAGAIGVAADWLDATAMLAAGMAVICTVTLALFSTWTLEAIDAQGAALATLARTDPDTRLGNRRLHEEALARETQAHRAVGQPLSLIMLEIDSLQVPADEASRIATRQLIIDAAHLFATHAGDAALVSHPSDRDLAVLLPNCPAAQAETALQSVLQALHTYTDIATFGVTYGLATFPTDATTAQDLERCADARRMGAGYRNLNRP